MTEPAAAQVAEAPKRILIMDAAEVASTLQRMARQIAEEHAAGGLDKLALIGIHTRGVEVARRLCNQIAATAGQRPANGVLDVSMHRDDLRRRPRLTSIQPTRLPVDLETRTVLLVDDVFFTGRTIRAALDALGGYGRAPRIQLAALIDRGHRELPIRPDFTGKAIVTDWQDRVSVSFAPGDGETDAVWRLRG